MFQLIRLKIISIHLIYPYFITTKFKHINCIYFIFKIFNMRKVLKALLNLAQVITLIPQLLTVLKLPPIRLNKLKYILDLLQLLKPPH